MSQESLREELERHPELIPLLDVDKGGNIVCTGWTTPVMEWDDVMDFARRMQAEREP